MFLNVYIPTRKKLTYTNRRRKHSEAMFFWVATYQPDPHSYSSALFLYNEFFQFEIIIIVLISYFCWISGSWWLQIERKPYTFGLHGLYTKL